MITTITPAMEENDLHIATHISPEQLPAVIRPVMALAQSDAEKDMLLLSLLTASGSCMPNLYFRYGISAKRYYANLQCFIVGSAASGKGIANLALELVRPIDECTPLLIPGDATYPAFFKQLAKQNGRGYIHESEGSELTLREVNETDGFHSPAADGGMWFCADEDYQTAELIGNKLILHMAQAYQMIEGHEKHTLPEVKALDQKQILLSLLPKEFESRMLINEAKAQGISARTSTRWNEEWIAQGIVIKVRHGHYKKQDACA